MWERSQTDNMFFHAQFGLVRCSPTASGAAERMFEHGRIYCLFGGVYTRVSAAERMFEHGRIYCLFGGVYTRVSAAERMFEHGRIYCLFGGFTHESALPNACLSMEEDIFFVWRGLHTSQCA